MTYRATYLSKPMLQLKAQFLAEVEFGVPSKKCINFGVCKIVPIGNFDSGNYKLPGKEQKICSCKKAEALVSILQDDQVELSFLKSTVSEKVYQKYFENAVFVVDEDYVFSSENYANLQFRIKKGNYPIKNKESLLTIIFSGSR